MLDKLRTPPTCVENMPADTTKNISRFFDIQIAPEHASASPLQEALVTFRTLCVLGVVAAIAAWFIIGSEAVFLRPANISIYFTATQDVVWLLLCALALPLFVLAAQSPRLQPYLDRLAEHAATLRRPVLTLALATLLLTAVGSYLVYHAFPLSLDEYMAWFQARIIQGGHLLAPIPAEWDAFVEALQPIFMRHDHAHGVWVPGYRPLGGALIALFDLVGAGTIAYAFLAAGSIVLVALIAHRIWPDVPYAPALAALLLMLSPQFLVTGMSTYAMTGHLFFNLLWLVLFLRDDKPGHIGAALTGFVAIGLHQIHIHPFFILPFMLALLPQRRLGLLLFYTAWYGAVLLFWLLWRDIATAFDGAVASIAAAKSTEGTFFLGRALALLRNHNLLDDGLFWGTNFARFIAWQTPAMIVGVYLGLRTLASAPQAIRLLAWGLLATLLPYIFFMPGQGHGWGYRYIHVGLGSLALIALHGFIMLRAQCDNAAAQLLKRSVVGLLVLGAVLGIPLRFAQVENFIRPFAQASDYISHLPAQAVIVSAEDTWFGVDLVRNDPYLTNTPKVLASIALGPDEMTTLCSRYEPTLILYDDLARFGMRPYYDTPEQRSVRRQPLLQHMERSGCTLAARSSPS